MAREILFKAKRKDNGEWVYGNYAFEDTKGERHFIFQNFGFKYEVDKDTICQYTGLTDKNGRKIFENDVVKHYYDPFSKSVYEKGIIKWDDERCRFRQDRLSPNFAYSVEKYCVYEVIGNIFDNPELLGGEDNG